VNHTAPRHLKWSDYRRDLVWTEPTATEFSSQGSYPTVDAGAMSGRMLQLPTGARFAECVHGGEMFIIGVRSAFEFTVGSSAYRVAPRDLLYMPPSTRYQVQNVDLDEGLYFAITAPDGDPASAADLSVIHMPWHLYRRDIDWSSLHKSDVWGLHRGVYPLLRSQRFMSHMVRHPAGQSSPWHSSSVDILFIQISGEVDFSAADAIFPLEPNDILWMPARTPYLYSNVGLSDALFYDLWPEPKPGETRKYYDTNPLDQPASEKE
jgi:mannose-6-phosphate isomerase-like protein (cupin superfamily)